MELTLAKKKCKLSGIGNLKAVAPIEVNSTSEALL